MTEQMVNHVLLFANGADKAALGAMADQSGTHSNQVNVRLTLPNATVAHAPRLSHGQEDHESDQAVPGPHDQQDC
jgi:hypothetical protein